MGEGKIGTLISLCYILFSVLGISQSYLSMILSGQRKASPGMAKRLNSLGVVYFKGRFYLGSKHSTADLHSQLTIIFYQMEKALLSGKSFRWYECQQFPGNFRIFGDEEQFILDQWFLCFNVSISY